MKFRTDFVTNSSSSSFILIQIVSDKAIDIFKKYDSLFSDDYGYYLNINEETDTISYHEEDSWGEVYMAEKTLDGLIEGLIRFFGNEEYDDYYDEEEIEEDDDRSKLAKELRENKEELKKSIEYIEVNHSNSGWQGDDESRYYVDWYEPETLEEIYKYLAAENNCSVDEITDEMFCEYVGNCTSIEENYIIYDKKTGKINYGRNTELI